ncbi:MAG: hypothetical protein V1899_02995 [Planctomycetota bacterium]
MTIDETIAATARGENPPDDGRVWIHVEFANDKPAQWTVHGIGVIEAREKLDTVRADMWDYAHAQPAHTHEEK